MSKKILLDQSEMNISDIAYLCGFSTSQYFATMFKKHEKCTPLEFRKSALNYV